MSVHNSGMVDWIDALMGAVFITMGLIISGLSDHISGFFTQVIASQSGLLVSIGWLVGAGALMVAVATNMVNGNGSLDDYDEFETVLILVMVVLTVLWPLLPFLRDVVLSSPILASVWLGIQAIGFALIAWY